MSGVSRRAAILRTLASLAAGAQFARAALAQGFPSRPLRLIVPFAPGGSTDLLARIVAAPLSDRLKQPVVVENRTGAGGNIGADFVAKSAPDGQTLVMGSIGTHATNALIYTSMPYDPLRDFAPVALVGVATLVLVVHPSFPARSVGELIQVLKSRPKEFSYASGGVGASQHLAAEMFKYTTHTSMQHVPYKGSAAAMADLLSGRVPIMFADLPLVLQHIHGGTLRALGVCDPERSPALPDVPTVSEAGVAGYSATAWYGLFAPAKTPEPVLQRLQHEVVDVLRLPRVSKSIAELGAKPGGPAGAQLRQFQEAEIQRWREVVRVAQIKMDA
ncbi:tripartite tricarboxylate transporter substrate binding protein [Ramlibacter sp.]|uniref:Bug family tripartite tricarboxylate transporter substrate binding protein n=1 Tax=Ramlibacter sp. TaxID=1917967 RepID=UPI00260D87D7|nr:tripartite tricarboxylate transporter substrate binding protein [Ramlibacter sp.]MDB5953526.1 tripartite tricarboxylate transporter substrate binding protein [Ramlibacter sp.]